MNLYDSIKKYGLIGLSVLGPNTHTYYVDTNHVNALDANDGEHGNTWDTPFATVAYAIGISNASVGSYNQNTIIINAGTYTEDLTVFPTNCDVIGVGSKVRISGNHSDSAWNCHWWNIEFRSGGSSAPIITLSSSCHGTEFHQCRIKNNSGNTTIGILINDGSDGVIEDCYFGGNPQLPIAIKFGASTTIGWKVINNRIGATNTGIQLAASLGSSYQNLIKGNYIGRQDPNSQNQMTYGIAELKTDGHSGFAIIDNDIEAVDAIFFTYTGGVNYHQWSCIRNRTNQDGTSAWEDA